MGWYCNTLYSNRSRAVEVAVVVMVVVIVIQVAAAAAAAVVKSMPVEVSSIRAVTPESFDVRPLRRVSSFPEHHWSDLCL